MSNVIIHLGGNIERINKTIEVALKNPDTTIIVSSEGNMQEMVNRFKNAGISKERVIFDVEALDTPGNFCYTYKIVKRLNAEVLYVVTDRFHMNRSIMIADICYIGDKIKIIPCSYMGGDLEKIEPSGWLLGNAAKTFLWKLTGKVFEGDMEKQRGKYRDQAREELKTLSWE